MMIAVDEMPFSAEATSASSPAPSLEFKSAGESFEGYTSIIRREPLGIVAGITPFFFDGRLEARARRSRAATYRSSSPPRRFFSRFFFLAQEVLADGHPQRVDGRRRSIRRSGGGIPTSRCVSLSG